MNTNEASVNSVLATTFKANGVYTVDCIFDLLYAKYNQERGVGCNLSAEDLGLCGIDMLTLSDHGGMQFDTDYEYLDILNNFSGLHVETHDKAYFEDLLHSEADNFRDYFIWCDAFAIPDLATFHYQRWHERTLISVKKYDRGQNHVVYERGNHTSTTDIDTFASIMATAENDIFSLELAKLDDTAILDNLAQGWAKYRNFGERALQSIKTLISYYPTWYELLNNEGVSGYNSFKLANTFTFIRNQVLKGLILQLSLKSLAQTSLLDKGISHWDTLLSRWNELAVQAQWIVLTKRKSSELEAKWRETMSELYQQYDVLLSTLEKLITGKNMQ